jgi:4-hydroxythreonine-4-phosphate dehydrogenase
MNEPLPCLAVTMGDPAGVGPELCLRLLDHAGLAQECRPLIFGDADLLNRVAAAAGLPPPARVVAWEDWIAGPESSPANVIHVPGSDLTSLQPGRLSEAAGRAAFAFINRAIDAALAGRVAAVATAPINKEALRLAGIAFPGHTEIFAHRCGSRRWCMMQYSPAVTCTFATVHVGYAEVPRLLTLARVAEVIDLTHEAMRRLHPHPPRIAVCGLNPHAGEHGLFGQREEETVIAPAIEAAQARGWHVEGPLPPDTAFLPERRARTDAFVCMYHDQGHIPVKALAFDSAVNTTLGLPVIRTSVDHGTAFDIAWQGRARPDSLYAAVRLAVRLAGLKT